MRNFQWSVAASGYKLEEVEGILFLGPSVPVSQWREYQPGQKPGLYRDFSRIQTPEDCLNFASRYGMLRDPLFAEQVSRWQGEAKVIREALTAYRILERGDFEALEEVVTERPAPRTQPGAVDWYIVDLESVGGGVLHSTLDTKVAEGTKEGALWFHLRRLVNDSLKDNVQVQLQKLDGPPELVTRPTNLLGFMWLQLAQEITGIRQRRICRQCGKGFWLYERGEGRPRTRRDAIYCSGRCKVAAYRKRKAESSLPMDR
ncbi:MAG: hypothetical protein KatS3mg024_2653 [Armatimonadota bacterium]|nr:MAG: hypothetical protein KatS3mg024_2653 [Armatimonadota bacterium]